jgi:(p)ppGpp synthase/HD superfamily hydrolase
VTAAYSNRFDEAVALAVEAFRPVVRKGSGVPYITHLMSVCALVGEAGGDEDQLIAAILHDYLEDIPGASASELERRFGARVARMVGALSDSTGEPKPPWRARKEAYLAHLRHEPDDVRLVSCADKLHNCRSIREDLAERGPEVFERFQGKRDGTLWYYQELVVALSEGWDHPMLRRLAREVEALVREA